MHPRLQIDSKRSGSARPGDSSIRPGSNPSLFHQILNAIERILLFLGIGAILCFQVPSDSASAQGSEPTSTPNAAGAYITVTYIEPINVRAGPSSYDYPVIGSLPVGGTAPALARSPAGEWIQISYPDSPNGIGWVYAANVSLSASGLLPVVEPPPTATPAVTPTINPTYAAALQAVPTLTRKPTFTAPPPLKLPTYVASEAGSTPRLQTGWIIVGLAVVGFLGMAVSSLRRR